MDYIWFFGTIGVFIVSWILLSKFFTKKGHKKWTSHLIGFLGSFIFSFMFLFIFFVLFLDDTSNPEKEIVSKEKKVIPQEEKVVKQGEEEKPETSLYNVDDKYNNALKIVKAEPKVISAAWNNKSIPSLLVGVRDDGTKRDGYAEYICLVLSEHGINGGVVRIMDEHNQEWKELGKAWCPNQKIEENEKPLLSDTEKEPQPEETIEEKIKKLDKSIEEIEIITDTDTLFIWYYSKPFSNYLAEVIFDLKNITKDIVTEWPERFKYIVFFMKIPTVDKYGNESKSICMKLSFEVSELRKINWNNFVYKSLLNFAEVEFKRFGRDIALKFCQDKGALEFANEFCLKALMSN